MYSRQRFHTILSNRPRKKKYYKYVCSGQNVITVSETLTVYRSHIIILICYTIYDITTDAYCLKKKNIKFVFLNRR